MELPDDFERERDAASDALAALDDTLYVSFPWDDCLLYTTASDATLIRDALSDTPFRLRGIGYPRHVDDDHPLADLNADIEDLDTAPVSILAGTDPRSDHYPESPNVDDDDQPPHFLNEFDWDEREFMEVVRDEFTCLNDVLAAEVREVDAQYVVDVTTRMGSDDPFDPDDPDPYTIDTITSLLSLYPRAFERTTVDDETRTPDYVPANETLTITFEYSHRLEPVPGQNLALTKLSRLADRSFELLTTFCPACGGEMRGDSIAMLGNVLPDDPEDARTTVSARFHESIELTLVSLDGKASDVLVGLSESVEDNADADDEATGTSLSFSPGFACEDCDTAYMVPDADNYLHPFLHAVRGGDSGLFESYRTAFADPFDERVVDAYVEKNHSVDADALFDDE